MARSTGGGSRSGGSRSSSSSRSSGSSGGRSSGGIRTSKTHFYGARKFRYYVNGSPRYIYSDRDLRKVPDAKPRYFLILFYLPFIIVIISMLFGLVSLPVQPLDSLNKIEIEVIDEADYLTSREERALTSILEEFGDLTGITTKIVLVEPEEWLDNGSLQNYSLNRYYREFDDEDSWLLTYSQEDNGYGEWYWESVDGDDAIPLVDTFFDAFSIKLQSEMTISDAPDIVDAFNAAFDKATEAFNNQKVRLNVELLLPLLFMVPFIGFHSYIMIFAGTRKKYSNKDLEEVIDEPVNSTSQSEYKPRFNQESHSVQPQSKGREFECIFCGFKYYEAKDNCCPNCGAIITDEGEA